LKQTGNGYSYYAALSYTNKEINNRRNIMYKYINNNSSNDDNNNKNKQLTTGE